MKFKEDNENILTFSMPENVEKTSEKLEMVDPDEEVYSEDSLPRLHLRLPHRNRGLQQPRQDLQGKRLLGCRLLH